ncbi:MAG: hypothetical protein ABI647_18765, partial [Gemmatimonadota bacterium]
MSDAEIHIRAVGPEDADWITALAPRLHEFGPPPWREVAVMDAAVALGLAREISERARVRRSWWRSIRRASLWGSS